MMMSAMVVIEVLYFERKRLLCHVFSWDCAGVVEGREGREGERREEIRWV